MQIASIASQPSINAKSNATLDYNAFLKLLVAQAKNQDPLSPMDPSQQLSQLASFSTLEQSMQTNDTMRSLLDATKRMQATSAIGMDAATTDGSISGRIVSVRPEGNSMIAVLQDGRTLDLAGDIVLTRHA